MPTVYGYRVPGLFKTDINIVNKIFNELEEKGELTPEKLVDISRPVNAPLHDEFEWDNTVAAEKWRCEQARQLIKGVVIVHRQTIDEARKDIVERAYVASGERIHRYVTLEHALTNEQWRNQLLNDAKKDMEAFIAKYRRLTELAKVIADMKEILDK